MAKEHDNFEDRYYHKDNKEQKRNRKILEKKDRSKFKKTDTDQKIKESYVHDSSLPIGRVISVESEGAIVYEESTDLYYSCAVKGSLKYSTGKEKNLLTIGDFVVFDKLSSQQGHIQKILDRRSTLYRADNFHRRKMQLIAANIDQVFITVSCVHPSIKPALIDRYIIAALKGNMKPVIILTKIDLIKDDLEAMEIIQDIIDTYKSLSYDIFPLSVVTHEGIDELKNRMKGKASVFSGQSGVGKTSIINLITKSDFKTKAIIEKTMKGSHTTTKAHLVPLECGGFCIDTPGIRSFGMWDLKKDEITSFFPEIESESKSCKFNNCTHVNEPGCSVIKAVEDGTIKAFRYESYLNLLSEDIPTFY